MILYRVARTSPSTEKERWLRPSGVPYVLLTNTLVFLHLDN